VAAKTKKKALADQVVVVTGASSGLGRAIARGAGERGARVVVTARNAEALDNAVREIQAFGGEALAVPADHSVQDDVAQVVEQTVDRFGRIDTYVANAMVTVMAEAVELEPDELRHVFETNFFGTVYGFWAALPHLMQSRGTFVDVNSALAYRGIPLQAAYCASKAAGRTFFESARTELQKHGGAVDICVVLPGAINTPQFDRSRQKIGMQPQPVPPIYQPEPFAEAVLHCCEHPVRELPVGWGAQKLLWGRSSRRGSATRSCAGTAGSRRRLGSRSRPRRRTTSSRRFPATRARTGASTIAPATRRSGHRCACAAGSSARPQRRQARPSPRSRSGTATSRTASEISSGADPKQPSGRLSAWT
jgi:NAD(P)-dependent dehydrogenase (short-subunit alcohol dehydrogenase family)